ncbi:small ribosomal subunit Rsm22 family protein [Streptomyces sp. CA-253872]|uniref:small ribosomal subunit Rsm22 family protein n=1 Tax=Streptomyces sp. CA-253872 TaxID=3240067 RepID=UPI003D91367E
MTHPHHAPSEVLRAALASLLDGLPTRAATRSVDRLIGHYRGRTPTGAPVLRDRSDVAAYAAYRMPATFEAMRAALGALATALPGWLPGSHLDIGGGTGAAVWAAGATWDGERPVTVVDWARPALDLGAELAAAAPWPAVRGARWTQDRIGTGVGTGTAPTAGLVTISYVLGELTEPDRAAVVDTALAAIGTAPGGAVVVTEPGTPEGYARVLAARDRLLAAGLHVAAPCPHDGRCPIEPGRDWCHFSARVARSSLHRQVKGGSLPYEDEKFAYVAATRATPERVPTRVLRRPQIRKGQVILDLCEPDEALRRATVTKRQGPRYRAARDIDWGDAWPPAEAAEDGEDAGGGTED